MYLDWILTIGAILIIVFLLYAIYILVQPGFTPEGFLIQTPNQVYPIPQLKGVMGRYVRIRPSLDPKADGYLTISQIEVLDINGNNIALNKSVTATSVGGSPIDKKYGGEVLVGNVYEFIPGVSDSENCIVDGVTTPRNNLTSVFETGVQNKCNGTSNNCPSVITTDTEYIEIDLGAGFLISSVVYTGRNDSETRTIQSIDGDFDYLTQIDRIKGMRLEIYDTQRRGGPLTYTSGLNYSTTFPTTDIVQTIKILSNLYGVNTSDTSGGSGSRVPLTTTMIPNLESFNEFIKPFQNIKPVYPSREADVGKSPIALAYAPMIKRLHTNVYSSLNIDISNNILLPILTDSPINFYYDIYRQSGCNPVCAFLNGKKECKDPRDPTNAAVNNTWPAYCNPDGVRVPFPTELVSVNIFGTASSTAIQEMNKSIEYCKLLYLGSPPAIENFIRVHFSFDDIFKGLPTKAYLRSDINPSTINSTSGSRRGSVNLAAMEALSDRPASFCVPDVIQTFRNGAFVTTFSAANNAWNSTYCTTEITPQVIGLIPFVSRNFIVQWVANRTTRYKSFLNLLSSNVSNAYADYISASKDVERAEAGILEAADPKNFTVEETIIVAASPLFIYVPGASLLFNPLTLVASISATKAIIATVKRDKAKEARDAALNTYNTIANMGGLNDGASVMKRIKVLETTTPMRVPTYISINSKTVIDSIAQQVYELLGGQFNIAYFYDILPLGTTMLDIRFDLNIHDSFSSVNGPINDLKAQYARIRNSSTVSKDLLDQAAIDYQSQLSSLEGKSIDSIANPFQGAVARLFYTKSGNNINITGIIFDDRAVTSFIPELNGGITPPLGPSPGNINYKPTVVFTKNVTEPLDCRNKDTLRRIFDDYILLVSSSINKYPLASATPPLDVTKGILYVTSVLGASQITDKSCKITWTETLYDANTNIPLNASGSSSTSGSGTSITRSAIFTYKSDTKTWYSSELILDIKGIEFLGPNSGSIGTITPFNTPILFTKPLPTRSTLDNLSNTCPKASCEDPDVLYSLVDQYNSDPTLAGSILTVTHAFTPNPNQCDVKVSINYDSQIKDIMATESIDPETGETKQTYGNVKKGAVTYDSVNGKTVMGSKAMPHRGAQKDITIALYVALDSATCNYNLIDASGQNSGTSIQPNTPALFTPMIYSKEFVKRNTGPIGSSINKLQKDFDQTVGSAKQTLKSYRIQGHNALSNILSVSGIASCSSAKCDSPTIIQKIKDYYAQTVNGGNGLTISTIINTAQTDKNACEMTFPGPNGTPMAYKFIFGSSYCSITDARQIYITGPTDEQILDITKEMNAGVKESFISGVPVQSEAIGVRGFGHDRMRNSDRYLKDTQYELPLNQREEEPRRRHGIPSYKFLRFTPTETRGKEASAVNVSKFTFFYDGRPLLLKGVVTNPMGTWEGAMKDVMGPGLTSGWSDSHKKSLVFAFREPIAIDAYSFTTSVPEAGIEGDPVSWKLESSQNGTFWTVRDIQTNFPTPVGRLTETQKLHFTGQGNTGLNR